MCMKKAGMTMDDVIDGVVKGGPDGYLYICLMTNDRRLGAIYRLVPASDGD